MKIDDGSHVGMRGWGQIFKIVPSYKCGFIIYNPLVSCILLIIFYFTFQDCYFVILMSKWMILYFTYIYNIVCE